MPLDLDDIDAECDDPDAWRDICDDPCWPDDEDEGLSG